MPAMVTHELSLWRNLKNVFLSHLWQRQPAPFRRARTYIRISKTLDFFFQRPPQRRRRRFSFTVSHQTIWDIRFGAFSCCFPPVSCGDRIMLHHRLPSCSSVVFMDSLSVCVCLFVDFSMVSPAAIFAIHDGSLHARAIPCAHFLHCNHVDFHWVIFCKYVHIEHCIVYFVSFCLSRLGSVRSTIFSPIPGAPSKVVVCIVHYMSLHPLVVFALRSHGCSAHGTRLRSKCKPPEFASYRQCHRHRETVSAKARPTHTYIFIRIVCLQRWFFSSFSRFFVS